MKLNSKGAASVLVILIIVVLATFGGIALTAGWTNKELSIRAAQAKADYYALDSAAEEVVAAIDSVLYEASEETYSYFNSFAAKSDITSVEKDAKAAELFVSGNDRIKSLALKTKKINDVYKRLYFFQCAKKLEELSSIYSFAVIYSDEYNTAEDFLSLEKAIPTDGDIYIMFTVTAGGSAALRELNAEIAVECPVINIDITDEDTWRTDFIITQKDAQKRFGICSWKYRQAPIDYEEEVPKYA